MTEHEGISEEHYTIHFPGLDIVPMVKDDLKAVEKTLKHMHSFNALGREGVEKCVIRKHINHSTLIDKKRLMRTLNIGDK